MLIPLNQIRQIYHTMLNAALEKENRGCTMYIFVSNDPDSLCALRIFTSILRQDEVRFVTTPVFSITHLRSEIAQVQSMSDAISSLVFINCGGNIDLQREWFYSAQYDVKAYVIDSHRPIYHMNVNDESQKIIVINDGCKSFVECPSHEDYQMYQELMRIEDDDDDMDEEPDSSDDEAGMEKKGLIDEDEEAENFGGAAAAQEASEGPAAAELIATGDDGEDVREALKQNREMEEAKQELQDLKGSDDDEACYEGPGAEGVEGAGGSQEEGSEALVGQKRSRDPAVNQETNAMDLRKLKRQKHLMFLNYYRGDFFGKCSSAVMYELAKQLNKVTNDVLWWRIVGFTDQILHQKVDLEEQDYETLQCQKEVQLHVPNQMNNQQNMDNDDGASQAQQEGEEVDLFSLQLTSQSRDIGHIQQETELKFMLLRHWTLFNSIQNSPYMVAKLNLAKEPGQQELLRFFSCMGCPLEEAKQQFTYMNPNIKKRFKEKIFTVAGEFGLNEIMMTSYSRQFDAKTQLSATDMAYAVSALLETPLQQGAEEGENAENQAPNRMNGAANFGNIEKSQGAIQTTLHDNFWVAYDALDLRQNNMHLLNRGIEMAKEMQQAIVRVGNSLIDKKEIKVGHQFKYCILENSYLRDTQLFQYPLALVKLAHFIMDCRKERFTKAKHQPLVISVKNTQKKTCLVVAVIGPNRDSETTRNDFNQRFKKAADRCNLKMKHDSFDSAVIEMRSQDWPEFIQELANMNNDYI